MPYIANTTKFFLFLVLSIGLISCNEDKLKIKKHTVWKTKGPMSIKEKKANVWKIKEPRIKTQEGQSIPFSEFNKSPSLSLRITDELIFVDSPPKVQIEIKSSCHKNNRGRWSIQRSWIRDLTPSLPIQTLIPIEMYHDVDLPIESESTLMHCQIKFTAKNSEGSTHFFEFKDVFILGSLENASSFHLTSDSIIRPENLRNPSLDLLYIGDFPPYLFCNQFQIPFNPDKDINEILFSKYDPNILYSISQDPIQECRIVLSQDGYAKSISEKFLLQFPILKPKVHQQSLLPTTYKNRRAFSFYLQKISIYNPHPIPLRLFIPQTQPNLITYTPTGPIYGKDITTDNHYTINFDIEWDNPFFVEEKKDGFHIELPPKEQINFKTLVHMPRLLCYPFKDRGFGRFLESGMWVQTTSNFSVQLITPDNQNVLKNYSLQSPRQWIGALVKDYKEIERFRKKLKKNHKGFFYKPVKFPHRRKWKKLKCIRR